MRRLFQTLDDASARLERGLVLLLLAVMALSVFADVVHRVASNSDGLILRLLHALAGGAPSAALDAKLRTFGVPAVAAIFAFVFFWGALRTAGGARFTGWRAAAGGLLLTALSGLLIVALLAVFPSGLVWSQPLALALLLWVALFGATLATRVRGHIVLEVADRIWPKALLPFARLASGLLAGAFCVAVVVLSLHYVSDFFEQWREGVGYVSGVPLPKWVAYAAIPAGFLLMAVRFTVYAVADFQRRRELDAAEVQA